MNQEKLKNIIILKDLPSNLIEEAIIILKDNNSKDKKKMEEYSGSEAKNLIKEYAWYSQKRWPQNLSFCFFHDNNFYSKLHKSAYILTKKLGL